MKLASVSVCLKSDSHSPCPLLAGGNDRRYCPPGPAEPGMQTRERIMNYTVRTNSQAEAIIIAAALEATQRRKDAGAITRKEPQNAVRQMLLIQERAAWLFAAKRILETSLETAEESSSIFYEIQGRISYLEEMGAVAHPSQIASTVEVEI